MVFVPPFLWMVLETTVGQYNAKLLNIELDILKERNSVGFSVTCQHTEMVYLFEAKLILDWFNP